MLVLIILVGGVLTVVYSAKHIKAKVMLYMFKLREVTK